MSSEAAAQLKAPLVAPAARRARLRPVSIVSAAPTKLEPGRGPRREPVRPPEFRIGDFDRQFDAFTLFYDAFVAPTGTHIVLLGPPLLNLRPMAQAMRVVAFPAGTACAFQIREMDRHAQIWVEAPRGSERLIVSGPLGEFEIVPRDNLGSRFAGRRVLFTLSKNNRLEWIEDWIRYHRDIHGADAVLIYDNASTRYTLEDLAATVATIPGIEAACVVAWPFKYGPQGLDARRFWDSDFCQSGALEHARWCFLAAARSAMNADVDELVISATGRGAFDAAERARFGVIRYRGLWVPGIEGTTPTATDRQPLRHRDFQHVLAPRRHNRWLVIPTYEDRCPPKWTVVPRRSPPHAQWSVHSFKKWLPSVPTTSAFGYRHFREISDNWKYDRSARPAFDPLRHVRDDVLAANFARVKWDA